MLAPVHREKTGRSLHLHSQAVDDTLRQCVEIPNGIVQIIPPSVLRLEGVGDLAESRQHLLELRFPLIPVLQERLHHV